MQKGLQHQCLTVPWNPIILQSHHFLSRKRRRCPDREVSKAAIWGWCWEYPQAPSCSRLRGKEAWRSWGSRCPGEGSVRTVNRKCVLFPARLQPPCVTLGKSFHRSGPPFSGSKEIDPSNASDPAWLWKNLWFFLRRTIQCWCSTAAVRLRFTKKNADHHFTQTTQEVFPCEHSAPRQFPAFVVESSD